MTENAQNADFRRKPQIFADSPLLLEIQAFGGRRKPQKTVDFHRKPKILKISQNTAGNRRLASVTLGVSPLAQPYTCIQSSSRFVVVRRKLKSLPPTRVEYHVCIRNIALPKACVLELLKAKGVANQTFAMQAERSIQKTLLRFRVACDFDLPRA